MHEYTVILRRPYRMVEEGFPDHDEREHAVDSYWALVKAEGHKDALDKARREVARADNLDWRSYIISEDLEMVQPEEYDLVAILNGHHQPVLWGWQL